MHRLAMVTGTLALTGVALAACGSSSQNAAGTTTTTSAAVQNLAVTPAVRSALLAAGAASHHLPVTDFTGLARGLTYYAYDPADHLWWAAAGLVPSHASMAAQVVVQDDGAYNLFTKRAGGAWVVYPDGLTGANTRCAIVVPAAVRTVWGWSLSSGCHGPAGI